MAKLIMMLRCSHKLRRPFSDGHWLLAVTTSAEMKVPSRKQNNYGGLFQTYRAACRGATRTIGRYGMNGVLCANYAPPRRYHTGYW